MCVCVYVCVSVCVCERENVFISQCVCVYMLDAKLVARSFDICLQFFWTCLVLLPIILCQCVYIYLSKQSLQQSYWTISNEVIKETSININIYIYTHTCKYAHTHTHTHT